MNERISPSNLLFFFNVRVWSKRGRMERPVSMVYLYCLYCRDFRIRRHVNIFMEVLSVRYTLYP